METEYKFVTGSTTEIQTKLNQWRHSYDITIHQMTTHTYGEPAKVWITLLIERCRKNEE